MACVWPQTFFVPHEGSNQRRVDSQPLLSAAPTTIVLLDHPPKLPTENSLPRTDSFMSCKTPGGDSPRKVTSRCSKTTTPTDMTRSNGSLVSRFATARLVLKERHFGRGTNMPLHLFSPRI